MDNEIARALGNLEGKVEAMHADLCEIKADVKRLNHVKFKFYGGAAVVSALVSAAVWLAGLMKALP